MDTQAKLVGKVKWFESSKGYGFIRVGSQDYFLHISEIRGGWEPREGDEVSFDLGTGRNGKRKAVNIRILNE